jgi:protein crumbs
MQILILNRLIIFIILFLLGVNCEIDIDECINNTCQFGSTCDDQINYYTCICAPGYHGDKCEIEINECDEYLPCKNGASCQDKIADYDCMCPEFYNSKQYGGKNCTVELTLCVNNTCMNGATCRPYLISEMPVVQQAYECVCQHGFTGVHCEIPTTMSFDNISFIKHNLAKLTNNTISIRFRTTLSSGILFAWDGNFVTSTLFCTIELWNGMLYVTYPSGAGNDAVSKEYHFPYLLNDSYWHEVKLVQTSMLTFELKSSKCSANCSLLVSYTDGAPKNTTWFGKPQNEFKTSKTVSKSNWIGCMEDIHINSAVLTMNLLNSQKTNSVNVESGCLRQEQCFPNSCKRRGTCLDLWNKYKCVCDRPFHGTNCDEGNYNIIIYGISDAYYGFFP